MQAVKLAGRVLSLLLTAALAFLLLCNIYTILVRRFTDELQPSVFGWSWAVVISGSMEPEIMVNDLIVVHKTGDYQVGDIVTYRDKSSVVTHRVIEKSGGVYTTKGDANNVQDMKPVEEKNIVGEVVYVIPGLGLFMDFLRSPMGLLLMVLTGFLLIELPLMFGKRREAR